MIEPDHPTEPMPGIGENTLDFFRIFLKNGSVMLLVEPASGEIVAANQAASAYYGYAPERLAGMSMNQINVLPPDEVARERQRALREDRNYFSFQHRLASNELRDVEVYSTPVDVGGRWLLFSIVHDATERKHAEREQQRLNRALRLLSDCNVALVRAEDEQRLLFDICRLVVEVGGYVMAWIGFPQQDTGKSVHPVARSGYEDGYLENIRVSWDAALDIGRGATGTAIRTGATSIITNYSTDVNAIPWREAAIRRGFRSAIGLPLISQGRAIGALTLYGSEPEVFASQEVALLEELASNLAFGIETLRMRRQKEAFEAELTEAQRIAHIGNWALDLVTGKLRWSEETFRLFEIAPDQFGATYDAFLDAIHPEDRDEVNRAYAASVENRAVYAIDHRILMADGRIKWVQERGTTDFDEAGKPLRSRGTVQDITERKRAESELRLAASVFANSNEGIVITDASNIIVDVNPAFTRISGYSRDEAIGLSPSLLASGRHGADFYAGMWDSIRDQDFWQGEIWNRRKGGEVYAELLAISTIRDDTGRVRQHIGIFFDISERKRTEALLLQSQKMEAIGTLASGIAHDFNNILTSILGFNHLILGDIANSEAVARHVNKVQLAGTRAKDLVRQILTFSRQMPSQKSALDLCQIVTEVYQLIRTAAPANVKICQELPSGRAMVLATSIQLHQILMNLCVNAIDAIGKQTGTVWIVLARAGSGFKLSVTDTGCGISREIQSKIFDPFFTTKGTGKGTGLGLSVVHGIVEDLGGTIAVERPPASGARFVIHLPQADFVGGEAKAAQTSMVAGSVSPPSLRVLAVDDDSAIVELLCSFLKRRGHRVSTSTEPAEALGWIRGGERFDVVITDQVMPKITGIEFARAIGDCAPGTRVLLCSGREDLVDYDEIASARIDGFIVKPFNLIELAVTV